MLNDLMLKYTGLLGHYVDARRPATEDELNAGMPVEVGGAGLVVVVQLHGRHDVEIIFDYGMGIVITLDNERKWTLAVYADQQTADDFTSARVGIKRAAETARELNKVARFGMEFHARGETISMSVRTADTLITRLLTANDEPRQSA